MKKIFLIFTLFVVIGISEVFAISDMIIRKHNYYDDAFEDVFIIKNNCFSRFVGYDSDNNVLIEQVYIRDNDFYNSENKKIGKLEKNNKLLIFTFLEDEYLSEYYEIDEKKCFVIKQENYIDGILDSCEEFDKKTGKIVKSSYFSSQGEYLTSFEYWKTTNNKMKQTYIYPDGEKNIELYNEKGKIIKETSIDSEGEIKSESTISYYENTDWREIQLIKKGDGTSIKYEYYKNSANNVLRYTEIDSFGIVKNMREYEYDDKGNQNRILFYGWNKQLESIEEYTYNERRKKISTIIRNKENSMTGKYEYTYDEETTKRIKAVSYKKNAIEKIREYDRNTGNCIKEYDYSNDTYYRVIRDYIPELENWFWGTSYVSKEIFETEEGVVAFYYTYERNENERKVIRNNKYSKDDKLLEWKIFEYYEDTDNIKKVTKYQNGKAIDIRDYDENGYLASRSVLNENTGKIERYNSVVFDKDSYYELSKRFELSNKITTFSSVKYQYEDSKNSYSDWNDNYKAAITKYEFGFNESAYSLLKNLELEKRIISGDGVTLVDSNNYSTFYCFKINDDGFIDFDSCYKVELVKK